MQERLSHFLPPEWRKKCDLDSNSRRYSWSLLSVWWTGLRHDTSLSLLQLCLTFIRLSKFNLIKTNQAYYLPLSKSPISESEKAFFLSWQSVAKSSYWRFITNPFASLKYNKILLRNYSKVHNTTSFLFLLRAVAVVTSQVSYLINLISVSSGRRDINHQD